jgi:hypothetical protein
MDRTDIFLSVVTFSLLLGAFLSPDIKTDKAIDRLQDDLNGLETKSHHEGHIDENGEYKLGSDHAHALFYVNLNGSEYDFAREEFQLRSRYVHMENFRPHIVHKHAENVTWSFFLKTMDIDLDKSVNGTCISIIDEKTCGEGSVTLNGQQVESLDRVIEQGDNLAVTIPKSENLTSGYMDERLPRDYRPDKGVEISRREIWIPAPGFEPGTSRSTVDRSARLS